jgi:hypothetical protein
MLGMLNVLNGVSMAVGVMEMALYSSIPMYSERTIEFNSSAISITAKASAAGRKVFTSELNGTPAPRNVSTWCGANVSRSLCINAREQPKRSTIWALPVTSQHISSRDERD